MGASAFLMVTYPAPYKDTALWKPVRSKVGSRSASSVSAICQPAPCYRTREGIPGQAPSRNDRSPRPSKGCLYAACSGKRCGHHSKSHKVKEVRRRGAMPRCSAVSWPSVSSVVWNTRYKSSKLILSTQHHWLLGAGTMTTPVPTSS